MLKNAPVAFFSVSPYITANRNSQNKASYFVKIKVLLMAILYNILATSKLLIQSDYTALAMTSNTHITRIKKVDQQELQERFKDVSLKLQDATSSDPLISTLITTMMTLFETQNEQLTNLNKQIAENQVTIEKLMALINTLNTKLGN